MKLKLLSLSFVFLSLFSCSQQNEKNQLLEKAKKIHENVITLDTHVDINVNNFTKDRNYTMDLNNQVTLPKMKAGGLDVAWFIVYTGQGDLDEEGFEDAYDNAMSKFESIHRLVEEFAPEDIGLATSSKDVKQLHKQGKMAAMIGIENGYPIGQQLENVKKFYNLGARYMSLAHQGHSHLSDSNTGEQDDEWLHDGLSDMGKDVVAEMNRLGMMIDVSHPSKKAIKQMFELSEAPLIASHSSARTLCNHSRNIDDDLLLLFKEHGGVVQTVAFSAYVDTEKHKAFSKASAKIYQDKAEDLGFKILPRDSIRAMSNDQRNAYYTDYQNLRALAADDVETIKEDISPVSISDYVNHIDYMVGLIGIDHVGISSDFDGGGGVEGWKDASETLNVTIELVKRGYTEEDIAKLWGENLLRVLDEVEDIAQSLQKA
jgi:membrane dipeptidase/D-alanyl-D-alanine dipeptidase